MFKKLLIANRGEIALRIAAAAAELSIPTLAIYSEDDRHSLHHQRSEEAVALPGKGASAYLNSANILRIAAEHQCDAIHPGYGFLSENAEFAAACAKQGICFIGPSPATLSLFGDKSAARAFAQAQGVAVLPGTQSATSLEEATRFFHEHASRAMIIKAIAGGGGRGMRVVEHAADIPAAFARCQSEALSAFGSDAVYVETFIANARHIEVQVLGDKNGDVSHLWERDCSIQRRHQKIVEVSPSPSLASQTRAALISAALTLAKSAGYENIGTFEFLLDPRDDKLVFIEANPRLQVEHTVTEAITRVDIVKTQLHLAAGKTLKALNLLSPPTPQGFAVQLRINMETISADGSIKPEGGQIGEFTLPSGPGLRTDTFGYSGYTTNPNFDSLLAKCIAWCDEPDWSSALNKAKRMLLALRCEGVRTNQYFLQALLNRDDIAHWKIHTRWVDQQLSEILDAIQYPSAERTDIQETPSPSAAQDQTLEGNQVGVRAPLQGTLVSYSVAAGDTIQQGQELAIIESMKMEHVVTAPTNGQVAALAASPGDVLFEHHLLLAIAPGDGATQTIDEAVDVDPTFVRPDLQEVIDRHAYGLDDSRPDSVARRHQRGQRTARENVADLCDADSFIEYGALVVAAQRARRSMQELIETTPGDGLVGGMATVNAEQFGASRSQCVVMSYDYMVFAGTQGQKNHRKKDRLYELAEQWRLPVVIFAEGGGGRPGETERNSASGLDCLAFWYYAKLKSLCPLVGIVSGRCFAGNAVLLGCSDVIIATENANIGMGGPAMIEGGGLGVFKPEEVGPVSDQRANGVIDIVVKDEAEAVAVAKQYLGYFQGDLSTWQCADQQRLRHIIPENRLRVYDVRQVISLMADTDSVLELRKDFAPGMITSLARIEGKPVGILANNPMHLGGAIDSPGADKAARFIQLCNTFNIPLVFLCDTPGIMVGPDAERTGLVRHAARLFIAGAAAKIPFFTVVLRKAYGLGAQTMAGGSFKAAFFTIAWPTGEFGGMGLEGAVRLGYRKELEAITDPTEREALFQEKVAAMYELGKATNVASYFDLDDVIDPKDTRRWIVRGLAATQSARENNASNGGYLDTW